MTNALPVDYSVALRTPQDAYAYWSSPPSNYGASLEFPDGDLGEIAKFMLGASTRPNRRLSLITAIAFVCGLTGRAYNVSNTGLNQYIQVVGKSGIGKDIISSGIELIAKQVSQVSGELKEGVPSIGDFIGAGDFSSYAGGYQSLCGKSLSIVCMLGEWGKKLQEMSLAKNPNLVGLSRFFLQAYSKSGAGQVLRPISYADKDRKTPTLNSPALTIIGEATPEIYNILNEAMVAEGTLPRLLWIDVPEDRAPRNREPITILPVDLRERIGNLAAACLTNAHQSKGPVNVEFCPHDHSLEIFDKFDEWCDDQINGQSSEAIRELHNRSHLKALKLAALQAVCANYNNPQITERWALWAIDIVRIETARLVAKFVNGEVGEIAGNQAKQQEHVVRVIAEYSKYPHDRFAKYGVRFEMHRDKVITETYISRRLITLPVFRDDKPTGATNAIKCTIKTLIESDELREIASSQMTRDYGSKPRAFVVANGERFTAAAINL